MSGPRVTFTVALLVALAAPLLPAASSSAEPAGLDMYDLSAPAPAAQRLVTAGYDVAQARPGRAGNLDLKLVLAPAEREALRQEGFVVERALDAAGRSQAEAAAAANLGGLGVWRSFDEPGGIKDEIDALAAAHPGLVERQVLGRSHAGREVIALRVTAGGAAVADGARPAVLYLSLQHAREWISGEVNRRLLRSVISGYGTDPDVSAILETTELWFVLVANPDGYERTFGAERLWRKNTRDNDGDGRVTGDDGVDLNRNFPDHFGLDPEGASFRPDSEVFRGPAPASEPETAAITALMGRVDFEFLVNYHSFGKMVLYPFGWQDQTPSADQPVYAALAGTPATPAIPGYRPQLGTDLYITNGETTSWAQGAHGTLAFTVELGEGLPGSGFVFPDNETLVRHEYELNRPFALDVARSAADPSRPRTQRQVTMPDFIVDPFAVSYGASQPVQVTVPRRLGAVELRWRRNGGAVESRTTSEWEGGERYGGPGDRYYRVMRGVVEGAGPGDTVEVWFEGAGRRSDPFTYRVEAEPGRADVLVVLGGEHTRRAILPPGLPIDVTGRPEEAQAARQARLDVVLEATDGAGIRASVYDVEANGHGAPHPLGVLGHFPVVVWSTDEYGPGAAPASVSRVANDEALALRAYLNEGGRVLYMGRSAGTPYSGGAEYDRDGDGDGACGPARGDPADGGPEGGGADGCVALSDDVFQYWLGAYEVVRGGGAGPAAGVAPVQGTAVPFAGSSWSFGPAPGGSAASFTGTGERLKDSYPQLSGVGAAAYRRGAGDDSVPDAAAVVTGQSVLFGFGFEDVEGAGPRADLLRRAVRFLQSPT